MPAIVRRAAPIVIAALIGAGCGDPGDPLAFDAGISPPVDAGPMAYDAGIIDAGTADDAGPTVHDAGIAPPSDSGTSGD